MDGLTDIEKARELVADLGLWPRVRAFLWDFAPQVHESWLADLPGAREDGAASVASLASSPRVKRYILESLGIEPCFHYFPKEDGSRILLLDGSTLKSVAGWLGALARADELRRVTDGATVKALKAALPGVYPEVFGYTAYFGDGISSGKSGTQSLPDGIEATGCELLHRALAGLPGPLVSRLKFKLPKNAGATESAHGPGTSPGGIGLSHVLKLLKLKFPEAYALCCS